MTRFLLTLCFLFGLLSSTLSADQAPATPAVDVVAKPAAPVATLVTAKKSVVVIPIREQIADPELYILRRGLKAAIEQKADLVVLDMDTPGGSLATTFEILEALEKFPGATLTYINKDAISAGAFIAAATHDIYFAPNGVIGAAAPVSGGGQDVDKTMKLKIVSYLKARVRSLSEGKGGYRGEVISAMIDDSQEFKIGDKVIKKKDELLSLTAKEAVEKYGEPPQPLLGAGIAKDIESLLSEKFGSNNFTVTRLEVTWAERAAQYLTTIKPLLLGLGLLALFVEFKTPGFGLFGISGIVLLGIVFLSSYVAGFSGHEPMLLFVVGLALVAIELFFFPGIAIVALTGLVLMLGSLVWAMADLWPNQPITITGPNADVFVRPLQNLGLGILLSVLLGLALVRFLPRGWLLDKMILSAAIDTSAQTSGATPESRKQTDALIGRAAVAATPLFPSGQIEIDGQRYEARLQVGTAAIGEPLTVIARSDFGLVVERTKTS